MADITVTSANVRALTENGAIVRPFTAGAALTIGYAVYIDSSGDVQHADANAGTPAEQAVGIVVADFEGETTVDSGDTCSVCLLGPVSGFSGMSEGDVLYVSNTVGRIADAAGSYSRVIGKALSATELWVQPIPSDAASS